MRDAAGEFVNDNTLTVYIKRLREKIEDDPASPQIILTVRGTGYRLGRGLAAGAPRYSLLKPFPMISLVLEIRMNASGSFFRMNWRSITACGRFIAVRMMYLWWWE